MTKTHDLKTIVLDHIAINYFYTREKNDINGNPKYRAYIIDPETPAVYERIFKTYSIEDSIKTFLEGVKK